MVNLNRKIYDCFCYFNEDMLLEIRFETLYEYVDYFVICESIYTQTGIAKKLNFDISRFEKYKNKIRYLIIDYYPSGVADFWENERRQKNYLINGLFDAQCDYLIIFSDLDEIPKPELIKKYNPNRYKRGDFKQSAFAYKFNNLCLIDGKPLVWDGSKITTYAHLKNFFKNMAALRHYKSSGLFRGIKRFLFKKFNTQLFPGGGGGISLGP